MSLTSVATPSAVPGERHRDLGHGIGAEGLQVAPGAAMVSPN
jgi:hypothetical protein